MEVSHETNQSFLTILRERQPANLYKVNADVTQPCVWFNQVKVNSTLKVTRSGTDRNRSSSLVKVKNLLIKRNDFGWLSETHNWAELTMNSTSTVITNSYILHTLYNHSIQCSTLLSSFKQVSHHPDLYHTIIYIYIICIIYIVAICAIVLNSKIGTTESLVSSRADGAIAGSWLATWIAQEQQVRRCNRAAAGVAGGFPSKQPPDHPTPRPLQDVWLPTNTGRVPPAQQHHQSHHHHFHHHLNHSHHHHQLNHHLMDQTIITT